MTRNLSSQWLAPIVSGPVSHYTVLSLCGAAQVMAQKSRLSSKPCTVPRPLDQESCAPLTGLAQTHIRGFPRDATSLIVIVIVIDRIGTESVTADF